MIVTLVEILVGGFVAVFTVCFVAIVGLAAMQSPPKRRLRNDAKADSDSLVDFGD